MRNVLLKEKADNAKCIMAMSLFWYHHLLSSEKWQKTGSVL